MSAVTLTNLHQLATEAIREIEEGASLGPLDVALIRLGLAASVTSLNSTAILVGIEDALAAGGTAAQIQEVISLVSGLGVHSLMATAVPIVKATGMASVPLTPAQQQLWDKYVGEDPFWKGFETELPGFLDAMLKLSADQFIAFFDYCAVPWKNGYVRAKLKELIAMACDASPAHIFVPGFKLHLTNAIKIGVGRKAILECLELAATAPSHTGFSGKE